MTDPRRPVVLFDWGETLVRIPGMVFAPAAHLACAQSAYRAVVAPRMARAGRALDESRFMACYERAAREQMRRSRETLVEHGFEDRLRLALGMADAEGVIGDVEAVEFARHLGEQVLEGLALAHPDVPRVVRRLHATFRLGIVSNYPFAPVVTGSLARLGLDDAFDAVVVSGDVGWMKPHAEIFATAARALPADPGRTVFVGDDIHADMRGAKAAGMLTAWYAPGRANERPAEADVHVEQFQDLVAWCEQRLQ